MKKHISLVNNKYTIVNEFSIKVLIALARNDVKQAQQYLAVLYFNGEINPDKNIIKYEELYKWLGEADKNGNPKAKKIKNSPFFIVCKIRNSVGLYPKRHISITLLYLLLFSFTLKNAAFILKNGNQEL